MGKRRGKGKKHRQMEKERELDDKYGKKQKLYLVSTAAGPVYVPEGDRIAVRVHNRITSVPVEKLTPDMHVIFWKQVLSHLTLDDVHNDLMKAQFSPRAQELVRRVVWEKLPKKERDRLNTELERQIASELPKRGRAVIGSSAYRVAHKLLHERGPGGEEIPVLRRLLFEHFLSGKADFAPEEVRGEGFREKLFKAGGADFSGRTYSQITNWIRDKAAGHMFGKRLYELEEHERKQLPSEGMLKSWLRGEVTMPRKQEHLKLVADATGNSELYKLSGLSKVGRFWAGRRSALMAYVHGLRGEGTGEGSGWGKPASQLTELEAILNKRIHEIRDKTVTVGVNGITTVTARPGELERSPEHKRRAKLSKDIVRAPAGLGDFERELNRLGIDTNGLLVSTWENDRELRRKAKEREERRKEHEKLEQKAWEQMGDFFDLPEKERQRVAKELDALRRRKEAEERKLEEARRKLERAKEIDELQERNQERMEYETTIYNALLNAAGSKGHGFGEATGMDAMVQLIDFLGEYGPDRERFLNDKRVEAEAAKKVVDGEITRLPEYAKYLLENGHSHTGFYKRLWENSKALQEMPLERFLSKFHEYDFNNYRGAKNDLKKKRPNQREAARKRMEERQGRMASEEVAMFDYLVEHHADAVEALHRHTQELPVTFRPYSFTRFLEHNEKGKVEPGHLWNRKARKAFEDAMYRDYLDSGYRDGYPLLLGKGRRKEKKGKGRR